MSHKENRIVGEAKHLVSGFKSFPEKVIFNRHQIGISQVKRIAQPAREERLELQRELVHAIEESSKGTWRARA